MEQRAGGGIGQILADHVKFVTNPASATVPIPEEDNNAAREAHRQAHATIFDVTSGAGKNNGKEKNIDAAKSESKGGKDKDAEAEDGEANTGKNVGKKGAEVDEEAENIN